MKTAPSSELKTVSSADVRARIESIRALLDQPLEQTAPNNQAHGWRGDCNFLLTEVDARTRMLEAALPHLSALARTCEGCSGAGAIVVGHAPDDYWEEPCQNCKPIWDLVDQIKPPDPLPMFTQQEVEDDIPF
jgi:hypothetical protein